MQRLINHHRRPVSLVVVAVAALFATSVLAIVAILPAEAQLPAQVPEPTPATVDPGAGTLWIDPYLWGILQKQSTGAAVPDKVTVELETYLESDLAQSLSDHITASGGKNIDGQRWEIPTGKTLEIVQRSDVYHAGLVQTATPAKHPRLDDDLNHIVNAISEGIPAADAAQYAMYVKADRLVVIVAAPDRATATSVQTWLKGEKVYIAERQLTTAHDNAEFGVLLPAAKIAPLVEKFATVELRSETRDGSLLPMVRSRWAEDSIAFEQSIVEPYLPPANPNFIPAKQRLPPPTLPRLRPIAMRPRNAITLRRGTTWATKGT